MTTHAVYDSRVKHPPRALARPLPVGRALTAEDVNAFPADPYWTYSVIDGALVAESPGHPVTAEDLEAFPQQPQWKYEVIGGTLIVSRNTPSMRHQDCALSLALLFRQNCPPEFKVVIAPFEYRPHDVHSVQPDLLVVRRPGAENWLTEPPVLVAEVLSPSTRRFDLKDKRELYRRTGVEHYWIVDPAGPSVEALKLVDGDYAVLAVAAAGQVMEVSEPLPVRFDPKVLLDG